MRPVLFTLLLVGAPGLANDTIEVGDGTTSGAVDVSEAVRLTGKLGKDVVSVTPILVEQRRHTLFHDTNGFACSSLPDILDLSQVESTVNAPGWYTMQSVFPKRESPNNVRGPKDSTRVLVADRFVRQDHPGAEKWAVTVTEVEFFRPGRSYCIVLLNEREARVEDLMVTELGEVFQSMADATRGASGAADRKSKADKGFSSAIVDLNQRLAEAPWTEQPTTEALKAAFLEEGVAFALQRASLRARTLQQVGAKNPSELPAVGARWDSLYKPTVAPPDPLGPWSPSDGGFGQLTAHLLNDLGYLSCGGGSTCTRDGEAVTSLGMTLVKGKHRVRVETDAGETVLEPHVGALVFPGTTVTLLDAWALPQGRVRVGSELVRVADLFALEGPVDKATSSPLPWKSKPVSKLLAGLARLNDAVHPVAADEGAWPMSAQRELAAWMGRGAPLTQGTKTHSLKPCAEVRTADGWKSLFNEPGYGACADSTWGWHGFEASPDPNSPRTPAEVLVFIAGQYDAALADWSASIAAIDQTGLPGDFHLRSAQPVETRWTRDAEFERVFEPTFGVTSIQTDLGSESFPVMSYGVQIRWCPIDASEAPWSQRTTVDSGGWRLTGNLLCRMVFPEVRFRTPNLLSTDGEGRFGPGDRFSGIVPKGVTPMFGLVVHPIPYLSGSIGGTFAKYHHPVAGSTPDNRALLYVSISVDLPLIQWLTGETAQLKPQ